ncbi:glycosyltransferase family 4 protein [Cohnella candidum]|uniref:Glycosyltransferase family 1 protein n=1 Tax=Cohnella candidum TaxID=2674991 RepID=A0A3G3JVG4_9BACL|nr:glycosyltransferase family 4 protein [Cohnella candidum]AYQ72222.1 glycosyltransferase family 1 protein [Cohnella candidum]
MRIAIIAPEQIPVPPILGGSVEITILAIAKELAKQHSVTVISRSHRRYPAYSAVSGVHIYRVATGSPEKYLANVRSFLQGKSFDVIQVDNRPKFVPSLKKMFPNAVVSLFLHSLTFVSPPLATREAAGAGMRSADLVIANSESLKTQLTKRFPFAAAKIRKVWLGVDTSRFKPAASAKPRRALRLLFAGRLIPRKGLPVLLRAVKLAKRASARPLELVVAGGTKNAAYSRSMRALSQKLGVNARFLGTVPHRRIQQVFQDADVFVCPSQLHEAFGLVNVEALATGMPVIASSIGGIKEIVVHNRNGMLIARYKQPQAFADAIVRLANDRSLLGTMKLQARMDCMERFSWSATAKRLARLYASPNLHGDA